MMDPILRVPSSTETNEIRDHWEQHNQVPNNLNGNIELVTELTKERDDLLKSVAVMRSNLMSCQTPDVSEQDVKEISAIGEDQQVENAKLRDENEKLRESLKDALQRLEEESSQERMSDAAALQHRACQMERDELLKKISEITATLDTYEDQLAAAGKVKSVLTIQVDDARRQLAIANEEFHRMRSETELEMRSTLRRCRDAEVDLKNSENKLQKKVIRLKQEQVNLTEEVVEHQRRLAATRNEALSSKKQNDKLTQQLNDALVKIQDIEQKGHALENEKKELAFVICELRMKETALGGTIRHMDSEYQSRLRDLDIVTSKQTDMIVRLRQREEKMVAKVKGFMDQYRTKMISLKQDNRLSKARYNQLVVSNEELRGMNNEHDTANSKMQIRLQDLEERLRRSAGYASTMMEHNDRMMKDNSLLEKELQLLQSHSV